MRRIATSGRAVHSNRDINRPDTTTYERRRVVAPPRAGDDRELTGRDGADPRQDDLAAVRMPAEQQGHRKRRRFDETFRSVRDQDQRRRRALHDPRDVRHPVRPVAQAGDIHGFAADADLRPRILQHDEARVRQRRRRLPLVVVVAEHREDAERRRQPGERLGRRLDEPVIAVGHVVAADDDEVGVVGHDEVDRTGDHLVGNRRAAVQVGEEPDAKAGERAGPAGDVERLLGQLDVVALVEESVRRGARRRAQCDRTQPLQQPTPRQPGRLG